MMQRMYERVLRRVLINGETSDQATIQAGVPQGAVLSPLLYALYIDGLHDALRKAGLGVWFCGRLVPLLLYADDIVLLASTADMMQRMLQVVSEYAHQWRFEANHGKSNVMIIGPRRIREAARRRQWHLCGEAIQVVDEYRYLGAEVRTQSRGAWNSMMERIHAAGIKAVDLLLWQGYGACGISPLAYTRLWECTGRPKMEYACELWEGAVSDTWVTRLEAVQYRLGKAVLHQKGNPAGVAVRMELGLSPL